MFDKSLIIKSFSRAAATYDKYSSFQKEVASELADSMLTCPGTTLDIGCGTGVAARLISKKWPDSCVYGLDIAVPMLKVAREKLNGRGGALVSGDYEKLPFPSDTFDTVVSSLSYQWAISLDAAFTEALRVLKPGGTFLFSTLGPRTMKELKESISTAANTLGMERVLPSASGFAQSADVKGALLNAGFDEISFAESERKKIYKDFHELLKTIKKIGASSPVDPKNGVFASPALLTEASRVYSSSFPSTEKNSVTATYELYFAAARRPK